MLEQRLLFTGLDSDSELRSVEQGSYLDALNITNSSANGNQIGIVTNVKGNVQVQFTLPVGNNKVIGSYADKATLRVYYLVYNDQGNHGIYRFSQPSTIETVFQDPILGFDKDHLINHINLVDGKLLYWTDGFVPQRKINVEKALENKKRKVNVYFGNQSATGETYIFTAKLNGVTNFSFPITVPNTVTPKDAYGVAYYIAQNLPSNAPFTAEACGAVLETEFKAIGVWTLEVTSNKSNQVMAVADNFYPLPYKEDFIDRLKYPKPKEPTTSFQFNSEIKINAVKDRIFQFAVQYIYDDDERTTLSPYSIITSLNSQCVLVAENYIQIDFTDGRLNDPVTRSLFKYVNLLFREHNNGKWKLIDQLQPQEWGINTNTYDFYNNGIYKVLDDVEANTLFTSMPQLAGGQEFIGQKIIDADITEGYDPVCVDAELSVKYNDNTSKTGFSVKGRIYIENYHNPDYFEPIHYTVPGLEGFYGGVSNTKATWGSASLTKYNQACPLKGFVAYLVGTDMYDISKQPQKDNTGLQDPNTGAYLITSVGDAYYPFQGNSGKGVYLVNFLQADRTHLPHGELYSEFEIKNVPAGIYVLRIASNKTVTSDLSGKIYQYTSMPTKTVAGGLQECVIEVDALGNITNHVTSVVTLKGGYIDDTIVYDLTNGKNINNFQQQKSVGYSGYLKDGTGTPSNLTEQIFEKGFELSTIQFKISASFTGIYELKYNNLVGTFTGGEIAESEVLGVPTIPPNQFTVLFDNGVDTMIVQILTGSLFGFHFKGLTSTAEADVTSVTGGATTPIFRSVESDHNGFFFISFILKNLTPVSGLSPNVRIETIVSDVGTGSYIGFKLNYNGTYPNVAPSFIDFSSTELNNLIFYRENNPASLLPKNDRTFINGIIQDSTGTPVSGVGVCCTRGGFVVTGGDGKFSVPVYLDFFTVPQRADEIIFSSSNDICKLTFLSNEIPFNINIAENTTGTVPPYDYLHPYDIGTYQLVVVGENTISAFKRGFDGVFGLVYYDRGLRSGTVNTNEKLQLHINFYTEKDRGVLLPSGNPEVSWEIKHSPPDWATHYQWVRTKNMQVSSYLQFTANKLEYIDAIPVGQTTTPNVLNYGDPRIKYVRIDITNLTYYQGQNKDSLLGYTWQVGDRIRFISDANQRLFTTYFDYKIEEFNEDSTGNWLYFVFDSALPDMTLPLTPPSSNVATFFELYTPRPSTIEKLYFEFGETFEIGVDSQGKKYHKGLSQNQDPNNPVTIPAKGTFRTGDVYYRLRSIPFGTVTGSTSNLTNVLYNVDDASISDFYLSKDQSIGRINIEDRNAARIRREKSMRWSQDYVQNTKINGLSWFMEADQTTLQKGEGSINKLQVAGRNVLAIQNSQVSTVYIYETQFLDAKNNPNVQKSDTFIGSINPLKKLTGTVHPESIKEWEGEVYGYDAIKGLIWRYANDGLDSISDYKFMSYFKNKAQNFKGFVFGILNPKTREYGVTFDGEATVLFCDQENSKRWISRHSYLGENYSYSGMEVIAFKDGDLWVQERNNTRNNFFGQQYRSQITFASNESNDKLRNFMALVVDGSDVWWSPDLGDISVPPSIAYPSGMSSRLLKTKFRRVGTDWYAPFMKDANTPNKPNTNEALINGRDLDGHVIKITLVNDSLDEVTLKSVGIRYNLKEFTKK